MISKLMFIIDDDETIVQALSIFFRDDGYIVKTFPNGSQVMRQIMKKPPDIVLIDYLMPGQNGAEITQKIRQNSATSTIPVIMLAATPLFAPDAYHAGVTQFITKPFDLIKLRKIVRRLLA